MLELAEGGLPQLDRLAVEILDGRHPVAGAKLVHRHPRCDREDPGAQVTPVLEPVVRAERAQERLLPRVLGALAEQPA